MSSHAFVVKDSEVPLDILFNKEINQIKVEEHQLSQKPKPITFTIQDEQNESQSLRQEVRFVIEGGGKAIQTSFVRKNEEEFFEFLNDFTNPNKNAKPKNTEKKIEISVVPMVSRIRRSIKSPLLKNSKIKSKYSSFFYIF